MANGMSQISPLHQISLCFLSSPLAPLSFGDSPSGISALFSKLPLLRRSLCIHHAMSFSHQRHLFPLIPHPLLFPYQALCSSDLLQQSSFCFTFPFFVPCSFPTSSYSSVPPFPHLNTVFIHFILLFLLTFLLRNSLSFLSLSPSVSLLTHILFHSPIFHESPLDSSPAPILHEFSSLPLPVPHIMRFSTLCIYLSPLPFCHCPPLKSSIFWPYLPPPLQAPEVWKNNEELKTR